MGTDRGYGTGRYWTWVEISVTGTGKEEMGTGVVLGIDTGGRNGYRY